MSNILLAVAMLCSSYQGSYKKEIGGKTEYTNYCFKSIVRCVSDKAEQRRKDSIKGKKSFGFFGKNEPNEDDLLKCLDR